MKRIIRLVNNERVNLKITSSKACGADATDICTVQNMDNATCTEHAYDYCGKDYAACFKGADDVCYNIDLDVCYGPGAEDN